MRRDSRSHATTKYDCAICTPNAESIESFKEPCDRRVLTHHAAGNWDIWIEIHHPIDAARSSHESQQPSDECHKRRSREANDNVLSAHVERTPKRGHVEEAEIKHARSDRRLSENALADPHDANAIDDFFARQHRAFLTVNRPR
jgi:hypothetical protein